jgi:UMF1 family MFS transporter
VALAMLLIIVSNTFFSWGESLTAAFLPELARSEAMGKVSGWGWGFGYFGGMLALGICLGYVIWAQKQGIKAAQFVPVTMLITAASMARPRS